MFLECNFAAFSPAKPFGKETEALFCSQSTTPLMLETPLDGEEDFRNWSVLKCISALNKRVW